MAKLNGPLFSLKASGKLKKLLTYKTRNGRASVGKYTDRGSKNITDPSMAQADNRALYLLILTMWKSKSNAEKKVFNDIVKAKNMPMSGFNYFVKLATQDPKQYLNLVLYCEFNRFVNNKINDLSKRSTGGTPLPSYPSNCPVLLPFNNPKLGKNIYFDGINDYLNFGDLADLDFITNNQCITISFWLENTANTSSFNRFFTKQDSAVGRTTDGFAFFRGSSTLNTNQVCFQVRKNNTRYVKNSSLISNFNTNYNHFFCMFDTSTNTLSLYVNNILQTGSSMAVIEGFDNNFEIGRGSGIFASFKMGNFMFFNKCLSATERQKLFDSQKAYYAKE